MEVNREQGETADIGHWATHLEVTVRVQKGHIVAALMEEGSKATVWLEGWGDFHYDGSSFNQPEALPSEYSPYDLFIGGIPSAAAQTQTKAT